METTLAIFVACLAALAVAACIVKPRLAVVPVLMMFPAEQILMGYLPELLQQYNWLVNVCVGLIALFGVSYQFFRGESVFKGLFNKLFILITIFYCYVLVSTLWTLSPDSAAFFLKQSWPYFFLFYCISPMLVKNLEDLAGINVPLIISGAVIMVLMLINPHARFNNDRFIIDLGYVIGYGEMVSNPLAIADAGALLAIVAAIYQPRKNNALFFVLKWGAVLLGLTLALMSGSRMQVVAAVGIIAIAMPFSTGARSAVRVAGSLLLVGIVLAFLYFVFTNLLIDAGQSRWSGRSSAEGFMGRVDLALSVLNGYLNAPAFWLIGLGASSFNAFFEMKTKEAPHLYPHNIFVESLTEYGLVGLAMILFILYVAGKYALRLIAVAGDDPKRRTTAIIFFGLMIFQFIMSMKQGYLLGMPPLFMFCLIVARVVKNEEAAAADAAYEWELEHGSEPATDMEPPADGGPLAEYPDPA